MNFPPAFILSWLAVILAVHILIVAVEFGVIDRLWILLAFIVGIAVIPLVGLAFGIYLVLESWESRV